MTRLDDAIGEPLASRLTLRQVTEVLEAIDENPSGVEREARDVLRQAGIERPIAVFLARIRRGDHRNPDPRRQPAPRPPAVVDEPYDGAGVETTATRARDLFERIKRGEL